MPSRRVVAERVQPGGGALGLIAGLVGLALIMRVGRDLGHSELRAARGHDRGDAAGPDSRGLFQQRDGWGAYEVRTDAYGSAVLFYRALARIDGRARMEPTRVAHAVQINRDPDHCARWWDDAGQVVSAIDAADVRVVLDQTG